MMLKLGLYGGPVLHFVVLVALRPPIGLHVAWLVAAVATLALAAAASQRPDPTFIDLETGITALFCAGLMAAAMGALAYQVWLRRSQWAGLAASFLLALAVAYAPAKFNETIRF